MANVKDVTKRWWELYMSGNLDQLGEVCADEIVFHGPGAEMKGLAALKPYLGVFRKAFPDLRREEVSWVVDGDRGVVELMLNGTHTGPLDGPQGTVPATGRKVVWHSADYIQIKGGKIVSWTAYWDRVAFATQLGWGGRAPGGK